MIACAICDKNDGNLNEDFVCATGCHHEDTSEKLLWEILALTRIQTQKNAVLQGGFPQEIWHGCI